ncbi:sigma-70 family RNA polymerase sigma factor [Paenibacillus odorifer]|jgi:RNA polymerase sigma-70 factor (TIGR02952 family)|uniref:RNA polymerase subunit sigma-24 n=1 Tax=Paenibacillus odorifer TaxID=189426 RepID=A0ABX3GLC7_9BACL|nr:sigma-70 family RNA polymerase sigma factor [Paenibacillus odorifer]OMD31456.1 RNA polymerase subunit sigma-24 [Paenibacillus odorifer]
MHERALLHPFVKENIQENADIDVLFTTIFETYYKRIFNYIAYRVSSLYTAEDLTSLVFEKTLAKLSTYSQEKAPLEVWLFAIARNVVNDHYRSFKRKSFFSLDAVKELVSSRKDPESLILQGERSGKLNEALNTLSSKERNIVALKFGANLRNREIAQVTGISESNIGVILYRTMKKLKTEIGSVEQL